MSLFLAYLRSQVVKQGVEKGNIRREETFLCTFLKGILKEFPEWYILKRVTIPYWAREKLWEVVSNGFLDLGFGRSFGIRDLDGIS